MAQGIQWQSYGHLLVFYPPVLLWPNPAMTSSILRFLDHTQRHTTFGRTPLDEWSTRRRYPYLKTCNIHNRQTSMPPTGFEHTIWVGERPESYAVNRAGTGPGQLWLIRAICVEETAFLEQCYGSNWSSRGRTFHGSPVRIIRFLCDIAWDLYSSLSTAANLTSLLVGFPIVLCHSVHVT